MVLACVRCDAYEGWAKRMVEWRREAWRWVEWKMVDQRERRQE